MTPWTWALLGAVLLIVLYELQALARKQITITAMIYRVSAKYPVVPFGFGLLMGHFFL